MEQRDAALAEVNDLKFAITTWQAQVEALKADKAIVDWVQTECNLIQVRTRDTSGKCDGAIPYHFTDVRTDFPALAKLHATLGRDALLDRKEAEE
jgi:hypothetical protein